MAKLPRIEILNLHPVTGGGNLLATANVKIGWLTLRNVRLVQQEGRGPCAAGPQRTWRDAQGQRRFETLADLDGNLRNALTDALRTAYEMKGRQGQEAVQ